MSKVNKPEKKELIKQSETTEILRSSINFAPYNPKKHTKQQIEEIKRNFKKVGFLGGIIVNKRTGNLIDGHKRLMAIDAIQNYDGSKVKDYQVKIESVDLDEKTEKEQNIFQSKSRTEIDNELLALIIPEIDYQLAGITEEDLKIIEVEVPNFDYGSISMDNEHIQTSKQIVKEESEAERKENIKNLKSNISGKYESQTFVTITFDSFENKAYFMETFGFDPHQQFIKGERFEKLIEKVD